MAVGQSGNGDITPGFSWTRSGGRYDFGLEPGMPPHSPAFGTNSDGSVIVGWMLGPGMPYRAYRRVSNGPLQNLGVLPGQNYSFANAVSGDGAIVVGKAEQNLTAFTPGEAFRWSEANGIQGLGYLRPNGHLSSANGISRDGSTIVGMSQSFGSAGPVEAFRWTESTGMQLLPMLPNAPYVSYQATAVNADGSVVVGESASPASGTTRAVRWASTGVEDLGVVSGFLRSFARAVDDSGNVIGGVVYTGGPMSAFVWTPDTGMLLLSHYLLAHGVALPSDYRLDQVYAISGDGQTFAGSAVNLLNGRAEGFVATIPSPGTAMVLVVPVVCWRRRRA